MVRSVKSVKFCYEPTPQKKKILETFREMVNETIRRYLEKHIPGRLGLKVRIYKELQEV